MTELLHRFDDAFSRAFRAVAMAEDGTRELALEQLERPPGSVDGSPADAEDREPTNTSERDGPTS